MATTFRVDDVEAVFDRLPTTGMHESMRSVLGVDLHHVSAADSIITNEKAIHPLLFAIHTAFAQHRPLAISPDHIWLTLTQGFAQHIEVNAEQLRHRFVRHEGRKEINVEILDMPKSSQEWAELVGTFGSRIAEHVGDGLHRLLSCDFTTTTDIERTAAGVVMMSTFKRYFDYGLECICGIPEITLEGEVEDWVGIRQRMDVLAEYDLEWWAAVVRPILDQFVLTARGNANRDFWQCIYKPEEVYGGEVSTGWIMRLFPYFSGERSSPVLRAAAAMKSSAKSKSPSTDPRAQWQTEDGTRPTDVPLCFSSARLRIKQLQPNVRDSALTLFGGFGGVRQLDNGVIRPVIAWAIGSPARMTTVIDRMFDEHDAHELLPTSHSSATQYLELPADLVELYDRMDSATLFKGRWSVPPKRLLRMLVGSATLGFENLDPHKPEQEGYSPATDLAVLPFCFIEEDKRFVALYRDKVILGDPRAAYDVENIPVIASSVAEFFEKVFGHEGALWFDDPEVRSKWTPNDMVYAHLQYHKHLRRTLRDPQEGEPIPTDLTQRELEEMILSIWVENVGSAAKVAFWWEAIRQATGTSLSFEHVFRDEGRVPIDALEELGLVNRA